MVGGLWASFRVSPRSGDAGVGAITWRPLVVALTISSVEEVSRPRPILDGHAAVCAAPDQGVAWKSWGLTVVDIRASTVARCRPQSFVNSVIGRKVRDHNGAASLEGAGPRRHRCHRSQQDGGSRAIGPERFASKE